MATLNLTANNDREQTVLENLIPIVSDTLAEKINNGVYIEKDGKRLLNKKDLSTFMLYATEQAKKMLSEQQRTGKQSVCVHGDNIMSWAIHYFEEDSIEGKLYNQDGTEYKPPAPVKTTTAKQATKPTPPPKPKPQFSLFDLIDDNKDEQTTVATAEADEHKVVDNTNNDPSIEQIADALQQAVEQKQSAVPPTPSIQPTPQRSQPTETKPTEQQSKPQNPLYEKYITYVNRHPDSVIAMRVGDFYEVFGNRAVEIAKELDLTLTGRNMGFEQRIPMVGFPSHYAEAYFKKIRQKHPLVIVDDDGERKLGMFGIEDVIDGDDKLTKEEMRQFDDELTEEEMRQFDGDIQEPKDIPDATPTKEQEKATCEPATDPESPYDETALAKVVKLLGDSFILG